MDETLRTLVSTEVFSVWFLAGAALVFWMQAGFAMVEAGFTRAKNTGNILMKNLMDFCIGTIVFILIGYGLLMGELTIPPLSSILSSVPPPRPLFQARWQRELSFCHIVFTRQSFQL